MSVFVDEIRNWRSGSWRHMMTDSLDELHEMAESIGLQRRWFQSRTRYPHYDLRPSKRILAIQKGAIEISAIDMIKRFRYADTIT